MEEMWPALKSIIEADYVEAEQTAKVK